MRRIRNVFAYRCKCYGLQFLSVRLPKTRWHCIESAESVIKRSTLEGS